ncbi:hypothetical protein HJFPF1_08231 [Paramyrothecium foliicola]|nr:hypothetical protein HJFPF1_08231 [Paramyrothecium foliicola]
MLLRLALLVVTLLQCCQALLEEPLVGFRSSKGNLEIQRATIIYDEEDSKTVEIAVRSLQGDWKDITGREAPIKTWKSIRGGDKIESAIIVGTIQSGLIKKLTEGDKFDVENIEDKWESFKTGIVSDPIPGVRNALVIAGSDKRGAAFGVYTLSEQSGQSPLHFWADVPATKHDKIYALPKTNTYGEPTVKYRGLFINDEAPALTGWWARRHNVEDYTFDSEFYSHVFDLIVRLKGNFIWPAMWGSFIPRPGRIFFTDDPKNQQLADDYGVVVSTSHHEPMQRASNEWVENPKGEWDWVKNKDNVVDFMEEGVRRAGNNESYFTLGMRGINDGAIVGGNPKEILRDVIDTQRQLLEKYHGNASDVRQVWTVYKEVQAYYEDGMVPPSDVTLMFADDNWGNVRRLPTAEENERTGGIGLYHHLAYVGSPKSYKWQNTNNLPKLYKELFHTTERGANQIWVFNIEDIKLLELPYTFAMELAWNKSSIDFDAIPTFLEQFSTRTFGLNGDLAKDAADVLFQYSHLVGKRKFEMTVPETYSVFNYHETDRILDAWNKLAEKAQSLHKRVPGPFKDTFFQIAVYPAVSGANYHAVTIGQGRNAQFALERRNSANSVAQQVLEDFGYDWDLALEYEKTANGKWKGMMATPKFDTGLDTWRPPSRDVLTNLSYVQIRQDFDYGFGNLGIAAQGSDSAEWQGRICASINEAFPTTGGFKPVLPAISPYGPEYLTVDLFHRGDHRKSLPWAIEVPYPWLKFSKTSGSLSGNKPEERIQISVDWPSVPADFRKTFDIRVTWEPEPYFDNIGITVLNSQLPGDFKGFPETGGVASIEAPHFQSSSEGDVAFKQIPGLGSRSESGSIALRPFHDARKDASTAEDAWVEYNIFITGGSSKDLTALIYVNGGLDTDPALPMRYSLTLDQAASNFTRLLANPSVPGDLPAGWSTSVADHVWKRTVSLGRVSPGAHTLRWRTNSPELYLEKIVVQFGTTAPYAYLGPPETKRI